MVTYYVRCSTYSNLEICNDDLGALIVSGNPIKLSRMPEEFPIDYPVIGNDTESVLKEVLDMDFLQIDSLKKRGVF